MADVVGADAVTSPQADESRVNAILASMGTALRMDPMPQAEPVVRGVTDAEHPESVEDVEGDAEPGETVPAHAQTVPQEPSLDDRFGQMEQRLQGFASREDMAALLQAQQTTQQQIAAALEALARQQSPGQPQGQPAIATIQPVTLTEAMDAYYLSGDRTKLAQYEAQERERIAAQQRERQHVEATERVRADQQGMAVALATGYPFLRAPDGWNAMMHEYGRLAKSPVFQKTLAPDPRMVIELGGQQIDLRIAAAAAETVRARTEIVAAHQQAQGEEQQRQRQTEQARQAPGAQGGGQQQRQTPTQAQHVIAADLVQGDNALLANPAVAKVLEQRGWGKDMRTQAKHLEEKVSPATRQAWQTAYRQGRSDQVRTA